MKIKRDELIKHLTKIYCRGRVPEVLLTDAFRAVALDPKQEIMVMAPPLERTEPLPSEIGVPNLELLVKSLGLLAGPGNEGVDVELRIQDHEIVIDEFHRGIQQLPTGNPHTIATRLEPQTVDRLVANAGTRSRVPLTRALADSVRAAWNLHKAQELSLHIGKDNGILRVGNLHSSRVDFPFAELKDPQPYSILLPEAFADALSVVTNYAEAYLVLGGPDAMVVIEDGPYRFFISPKTEGADA